MAGEDPSLLIAQMTDIHIGFDPARGDEEPNLLRYRSTLERLMRRPDPPDMLVLTGDLTERGDAQSFARLVEPLTECTFPVFPLVGNHDIRESLLKAFPDCPSEGGFIQYAIAAKGLRILCLDTFEPGRHGGAFCEDRAGWLSDQLAAHPRVPTLIFMHHPPVVSGIDWMDPDPDEPWIARFRGAIAGHDRIIAIQCGHLHRPISTSFGGVSLGVAPSVAPPVALDLRTISPHTPDDRALVAAEPPGYAIHRWDGARLVSHFETVGDWEVLARYDAGMQPMIGGMLDERN